MFANVNMFKTLICTLIASDILILLVNWSGFIELVSSTCWSGDVLVALR